MKKYFFLAVIGLLFFLFNQKDSKAEQEPPEKIPNPFLRQVVTDFDAYVHQGLKSAAFPGAAIAIVKDGAIIYSKGFGWRTINTKKKVDEHTVFRLASVSKSFAAILTGMLVDENQLSWNDKVKKHLPEFQLHDKDQANRIRLQHLLSHTTGLPYHTYTNLVEAGLTTKAILPQLSTVPLIAKEGEIYSYQNAAFSVIGEVIQTQTQKTYAALLKEKIFVPLNMNQASCTYQAIQENSNTAFPHRKNGANWKPRKISEKYYNSIPAGGVNASILDMAAYLQLLMGHNPDLIRAETLKEIFQPFVKTPIKRRYFGKWPAVETAHYAMGFRVLDYHDQTMIYHGGSANGYHSELAILPEENIGICILMNAPSSFSNESIPIFFDAYEQQSDSIRIWEMHR